MNAIQEVRAAAVAGMFYPQDAKILSSDIQAMLKTASNVQARPGVIGVIKALIVPHAGYIYSGSVAASAYALLAPLRETIRRVVLLGPTHRVFVSGLVLPGVQAFETPLGRIPVDQDAVQFLKPLRQVSTNPAAHELEHSLEVQLPFLQTVLSAFQLVPLAVGDASPEAVAEVIELLWGGPETLIVVSSDLSHYHPYHLAQKLDQRTCDSITDLQQLESHQQACGATPVNGLLLVARQQRLKPNLLAMRNSGDTAGDRDRVVGYGAFAFTQEPRHGI